jgi:hypothetical protein
VMALTQGGAEAGSARNGDKGWHVRGPRFCLRTH